MKLTDYRSASSFPLWSVGFSVAMRHLLGVRAVGRLNRDQLNTILGWRRSLNRIRLHFRHLNICNSPKWAIKIDLNANAHWPNRIKLVVQIRMILLCRQLNGTPYFETRFFSMRRRDDYFLIYFLSPSAFGGVWEMSCRNCLWFRFPTSSAPLNSFIHVRTGILILLLPLLSQRHHNLGRSERESRRNPNGPPVVRQLNGTANEWDFENNSAN